MRVILRSLLLPAFIFFAACTFARASDSQPFATGPVEETADASADPQTPPGNAQQQTQPGAPASTGAANPRNQNQTKNSQKQPKRILGIMPNYRAVSAGQIPPPPTAGQSFKIATQNSFDYSAYPFDLLTSLFAEETDAHPKLGEGLSSFWGYSWRGFVDRTDGNYLVIFALPTLLHEDERYYAMGEGRKLKRAVYAATRVLITPDYHGHNTLNVSELLGRGIAQGISTAYYPAEDRTLGEVAVKWGYAVMRDAATNVFREFWPDIDHKLFHRHPAADTTP